MYHLSNESTICIGKAWLKVKINGNDLSLANKVLDELKYKVYLLVENFFIEMLLTLNNKCYEKITIRETIKN